MTDMVDIGDKNVVARRAKAMGEIRLKKDTIEAIRTNKVKKGDVLSTAKVAAIQAVKDTSRIMPLCHQIPITGVSISFELGTETVTCECDVSADYKTGVEMEALVGTSIALLTVWDMVKYLEKDEEGQYPNTRIEGIKVIVKEKKEKG